MCTESLLGVSEAQAVPGRVRAPGTVQTARQVALHRVTGGSLPRRRRLFSEGSRDAAPGRASEARSLSVRFPPPWQPCSPGLPEVRLRLLGQRDRDRELCFPPGWCCSALWEVPQSGELGGGAGAGITVLQDLFFNIQPPLFLFFLVGFPQASHAHSTSRAEESFQGPFRRDLDLQLSSFISSPVPIQSTLVT